MNKAILVIVLLLASTSFAVDDIGIAVRLRTMSSTAIEESAQQQLDGRYDLGLYAYNHNQLGDAWILLRWVVDESDRYPVAYFVLGKLCIKAEEYGQARQYFLLAIAGAEKGYYRNPEKLIDNANKMLQRIKDKP